MGARNALSSSRKRENLGKSWQKPVKIGRIFHECSRALFLAEAFIMQLYTRTSYEFTSEMKRARADREFSPVTNGDKIPTTAAGDFINPTAFSDVRVHTSNAN